MPINALLYFATAALAVVLIPGPRVLLVSSYALAQGLRPVLLCILGICLGDLVAVSLTFLGLGAVLAASASLFLVLNWVCRWSRHRRCALTAATCVIASPSKAHGDTQGGHISVPASL